MPGEPNAEFPPPARSLAPLHPSPGLRSPLPEAPAPLSGVPAPLLQVQALRKEYKTGRGSLVLFDNLNFSVFPGELVAIIGESGAGKSSLLHLLGALDAPTSGKVLFRANDALDSHAKDGHADPIDLCSLPPNLASEFRNRQIGYVWQAHYLLPEFTALENVAMPLLARGEDRKPSLAKALDRLSEVELADRADHRSGELSGGEQQRVSLARALVTNPRLLLADEPTGDLDHRTSEVVFSLIERLHAAHRLTSILVTHNPAFARRCTRVFQLRDRRMEEISPKIV